MIDLMSYSDFESLLQGERGDYYSGRWEYFREVIEIIKQLQVAKVLELGPGLLPVVKNADLMINPQEDPFGRPKEWVGKTIVFDATRSPWPIRDKEYDLVIALQVWEHLDDKQSRAFREVMRVSKRAVLSVPYKWEGGQENARHRAHRDIDKELVEDWTLHIKPKKIIEIPRTGTEFSKGPRLIYFWEF